MSVGAGELPRKLEKAPLLGADEIVIDLEDSVVPAMKATALRATIDTLQAWSAQPIGTSPSSRVSVRINPPRTPWCHCDLLALASAGAVLSTVVVPKVRDVGDVAFVERLLDGAEAAAGRPVPLGLQLLIETASGLGWVREVAGASSRVESLIIGYADLGMELGRADRTLALPESWVAIQDAVLGAARAHGLQAIDGPFLDLGDEESFRRSSQWARDLGFDGKWAIHPSQIPVLNELFRPSQEEIRHARAVLVALERDIAGAPGAVLMGGEMLDEAKRQAALRVLERAETER